MQSGMAVSSVLCDEYTMKSHWDSLKRIWQSTGLQKQNRTHLSALFRKSITTVDTFGYHISHLSQSQAAVRIATRLWANFAEAVRAYVLKLQAFLAPALCSYDQCRVRPQAVSAAALHVVLDANLTPPDAFSQYSR
jgi:hypothetical protein